MKNTFSLAGVRVLSKPMVEIATICVSFTYIVVLHGSDSKSFHQIRERNDPVYS